MGYYFGKQDFPDLGKAQEKCVLMTNGLGGFAGVTAGFGVNRADQGILVAAVSAPNVRICMVHRLREQLVIGDRKYSLSTQRFALRGAAEEGFRNLTGFSWEGLPRWDYQAEGVRVERELCTVRGQNASAVRYRIHNESPQAVTLHIDPFLKFAPKEEALKEKKTFTLRGQVITDGTYTLYIHTDGQFRRTSDRWQTLAYPEDAMDGRPDRGLAGSCCRISRTVAPGEQAVLRLVFSLDRDTADADTLMREWEQRQRELEKRSPFRDSVARELTMAADAYIARRDSTDGKTILAGYPLFSDWGRDTMIALPGCCLSTGRYEDARSILRTFLAYEKDGLVPNLFPEGGAKPMYNTVDAALLLIGCVWQYLERTGDTAFVREAWGCMERIIANYRRGTHHSIRMDEDGLIMAGSGLDQVTWMDVCVEGILPTPRHGKCVEINAYWYSALRIMDTLARQLGMDPMDYGTLAEKVKASFTEKFYMEDRGYLKDVLSGTDADTQLRCNQIWAVSQPFCMLTAEQEKNVVAAVRRHLYTPCGLRTLSPEDPEYKGHYGGPQLKRDLAYHQGTTWVFPMGAYYLAELKVRGGTPEAARLVRKQLRALESMLREGCLGQLPEIYDGDNPTRGKGCYAQAWSVGEMLRVFEALEQIG